MDFELRIDSKSRETCLPYCVTFPPFINDAAAPRPQSPLNGELAAIASDHDYSDLEAKTNAEVVALLAQIRQESVGQFNEFIFSQILFTFWRLFNVRLYRDRRRDVALEMDRN